MSIVIHFVAPPVDQSFSFEGTVAEFQKHTASIRTLLNTEENDGLITVTLSPIAKDLGTEPGLVLNKIIALLEVTRKTDVRFCDFNDGTVSVRTEIENGRYVYRCALNEMDILAFSIGYQEEVTDVLGYLDNIDKLTDIFGQFLSNVKSAFPVYGTIPSPAATQETVPEPAFTPAEETTELKPRVKLSDVQTERPPVPKKKFELGILVSQLGGPIIEVVVMSPYANKLATDSFRATLRTYLKDGSYLIKNDEGRHVLIVNKEQAGQFEEIIRSVIKDHNADDELEIGREEYYPNKAITGRVYL